MYKQLIKKFIKTIEQITDDNNSSIFYLNVELKNEISQKKRRFKKNGYNYTHGYYTIA